MRIEKLLLWENLYPSGVEWNDIVDNICDFLLCNAGTSIVYRVRNEVLGNLDASEAQRLQSLILNEKKVRHIIESAQPDGWLGTCFHSRMRGAKPLDVCEAALLYLAEKGVDLKHPVFSGVMNAYQTRSKTDPIFDGFEKTYDRYDICCWGLWLIRAAGIARAGYEESIDISREVEFSLNSFLNVLNYEDIEQVTDISKSGKRFFPNGTLWPCNYHLKILAFTNGWRSKDKLLRLGQAVEHLLSMPGKGYPIYTKVNNYYASPCDAFIGSPIESFNRESVNGRWFDKMELFARCGIVPFSERLAREVSLLRESIDEQGICRANVDEGYFKNWGAYSGLQLEENWRSGIKRSCDISFRALEILDLTAKSLAQ